MQLPHRVFCVKVNPKNLYTEMVEYSGEKVFNYLESEGYKTNFDLYRYDTSKKEYVHVLVMGEWFNIYNWTAFGNTAF